MSENTNTSAFVIISSIIEMYEGLNDRLSCAFDDIHDLLDDMSELSTVTRQSILQDISTIRSRMNHISSKIDDLTAIGDILSAYAKMSTIEDLSAKCIETTTDYASREYYDNKKSAIDSQIDRRMNVDYVCFKTPTIPSSMTISFSLSADETTMNDLSAFNVITRSIEQIDTATITSAYSNSMILCDAIPNTNILNWKWNINGETIEDSNAFDSLITNSTDSTNVKTIKINGMDINEFLTKHVMNEGYVLSSIFYLDKSNYVINADIDEYIKKNMLSAYVKTEYINANYVEKELLTALVHNPTSTYVDEKLSERINDEFNVSNDEYIFKTAKKEFENSNGNVNMKGKPIQTMDYSDNISISFDAPDNENVSYEVEVHMRYSSDITTLTFTCNSDQNAMMDIPSVILLPNGKSNATAVFKIQTLYSKMIDKWVHHIRYSHRY